MRQCGVDATVAQGYGTSCVSCKLPPAMTSNEWMTMSGSQGFLTTHVLDTANGAPAAGVIVELYSLSGANRSLLVETCTNDDGRTDAPLLKAGAMPAGVYELVFRIGDYFKASGTKGAGAFVDVVPIRFVISDLQSHYHVPLLASPFSYSTYRGS